MSSARYVPELDGVRALAVWLVMLFHAGAPFMAGGWVGVDVFFVLSGFLITTLLIAERQRYGHVRIGQFWMRRILRLFPAYFLYLVPITILFVSSVSWDHSHAGWSAPAFLASLWGYFSNLTPRGGIWESQYLVIHLWSLAVEQQFYVLLCALYLLSRRLGASLGMVLLIFLATAIVISHAGIVPGAERLSLFGRGTSLIIGCLAACYAPALVERVSPKQRTYIHISSVVAAVLLILATLLGAQFFDIPKFGAARPFDQALYTAVALAVAGYWYGWSTFGSFILKNRFLVAAGRISYGIYLYHMAAWGLTFHLWAEHFELFQSSAVNYGLKLGVYLLLSHITAALSYRYVETPFLSLKRRFAAS